MSVIPLSLGSLVPGTDVKKIPIHISTGVFGVGEVRVESMTSKL
ncbi:hypothetical protein BD780_000364 [Clostridium tetanomorphum]|nr:hypothetical protein [Clostridium tetanomorphum]MBP1864933.1 hypothetical protein [Clostridium tetanomorphum]NRS83139.1 hypothetical protein [Clostridium tetanomorphum]NRZ98760.1 hypothetical protein [Clostridium tetanomorphum]SQC01184.1 Uncharacterised protein [Clostridium tetanomorphum]